MSVMKEKIATIIKDGVCSGDSSWDEITHKILVAIRFTGEASNIHEAQKQRYFNLVVDEALKE